MRGGHARQRGRHLWAEGDRPLALVVEVIKLSHDLLAALGGKQFERFERGAVIFPEAVAAGDRSPTAKNKLARTLAPHTPVTQPRRVKITQSTEAVHTDTRP